MNTCRVSVLHDSENIIYFISEHDCDIGGINLNVLRIL